MEFSRTIHKHAIRSAAILTTSYVAVSREALGETFKAATFKIIVDKCSAITYRSWAGDRDLSIYSVALHTFRAYANSVIKSEATLVAGTPSTDLEIQDDLGLLEKIGDRVYKMEFDEKTILSQDNLDTLAYNLLSEFYKKHTQLRVQELYNPELEMGLTMEVVDTSVHTVPTMEDFYKVLSSMEMEGVRIDTAILKEISQIIDIVIKNLEKEIPDWNSDGIREQAKNAWQEKLAAFTLKGASDKDKRIFYTQLLD